MAQVTKGRGKFRIYFGDTDMKVNVMVGVLWRSKKRDQG